MATMCQRVMKGRACRFGWFMLVPAMALLALAVAIALVPQALTWLVAGALVCAAGMSLVAAWHVHRLSKRAT